ncbi:MAG: ion channel [Pseudomonadota bacterium]
MYRRNRISRLLSFFVALIILHTISMVIFENMSWWDGLWVTMTTATTVGYGDFSASTVAGRLSTTLLMYIVGISLLAQLASEYIEFRLSIFEKKSKGQWIWKHMENHIVIVNTPKYSSERYLSRLVTQLQSTPSLKQLPVQLLTTSYPDSLPKSLQELGVVHFTGRSQSEEALSAVKIKKAKYAILLSRDENDAESDSFTFDCLESIASQNKNIFIVAEAVDDKNRERFLKYGADAVIRPIRAYPELVVRAMASPGSEVILEDLFTHEGDHPLRLEIEVADITWKMLVTRLLELELGMPIGYVDKKGQVHTNPSFGTRILASAVLILADASDEIDPKKVEEHLASYG